MRRKARTLPGGTSGWGGAARCAFWWIGAGRFLAPSRCRKVQGGAPAPARWGARFRVLIRYGAWLSLTPPAPPAHPAGPGRCAQPVRAGASPVPPPTTVRCRRPPHRRQLPPQRRARQHAAVLPQHSAPLIGADAPGGLGKHRGTPFGGIVPRSQPLPLGCHGIVALHRLPQQIRVGSHCLRQLFQRPRCHLTGVLLGRGSVSLGLCGALRRPMAQ